MRIWALRFAAIIVCGLLLCSCAASDKEPPLAQQGKTLVLEVDSQLGTEVMDRSRSFAERVKSISGGALKIEVRTGTADVPGLESGACDMAFLSGKQAAQADAIFEMLSLPFLYDDATHMDLALNSEEMTGILRNKLAAGHLVPVAALYNGSLGIVTDRGVLRIPADYKKLVIAVRADGLSDSGVFRQFGAVVAPYPAQSLIQVFNAHQKVQDTEGNLYDKADAVELSPEQVPELLANPNSLYFIRTGHQALPIWLLGNAQTFSSLSNFEQAAIQEAAAGLIAEIEQDWQEKELDLIQQMKAEGVTIVDAERLEFAAALYDSGDSSRLPSYFDRQIYKTIQLFIQ